uniref:Immunoglobulin V-set domain-containing protein n=1 Tax=Chrysemys picta bellii TaxID=8478 RepID=A0A8C3H617_CHRPI
MELHQGSIWPLVHVSLMGNVFQEYDAMEGRSLSVQCPYNTQDYKEEKKAWCRSRVQNECNVLVNTDHRYFTYQNSAQKGRARIHDDTQKGIVTITMEKLQVDNAGVYEPPRLYRIIEVKLAVAKGEYLLVGKMWGFGFVFFRFQPPTFPTLSDTESVSPPPKFTSLVTVLSLTLAAAALWSKRNDVKSGCIESK